MPLRDIASFVTSRHPASQQCDNNEQSNPVKVKYARRVNDMLRCY
jgi:hypothetical protein